MKSDTSSWFVIRKYNCAYNDEYVYHLNEGKLLYKFLSEKVAKQKLEELERDSYRSQFEYLGDLISNYADSYMEKDKALREFLLKQFGIELGEDIRYGQKPDRIPTDTEIDTLRDIIGFRFYSVTQYQENDIFYEPELNPKVFNNAERTMNFIHGDQLLTLYSTYAEALQKIARACLGIAGYHPVIEGELEEISPTPELLLELISSRPSITYSNKKLEFDYDSEVPILINDLFYEKPFLVHERSLNEIESIKD